MPYPTGMNFDSITEHSHCEECGVTTQDDADICYDCYMADSIADRDEW